MPRYAFNPFYDPNIYRSWVDPNPDQVQTMSSDPAVFKMDRAYVLTLEVLGDENTVVEHKGEQYTVGQEFWVQDGSMVFTRSKTPITMRAFGMKDPGRFVGF